MRKIRFRGKSIKDGKMVTGYFRHWDDNKHHYILTDYMEETSDFRLGNFQTEGIRVEPSSVGQFTGLKDKNGVEIYEGDIVRVESLPHKVLNHPIVSWGEKSHGWSLKCEIHSPWLNSKFKYYSLLASKNIEVIGNIHTNQSL